MNISQWIELVINVYKIKGKELVQDKSELLMSILKDRTQKEQDKLNELRDMVITMYGEKNADFTTKIIEESMPELFGNCNVDTETYELLKQFFFDRATRGETFGDIKKIKQKFGKTLEENYGIAKNSFIDFAYTYWTYKIEVDEIPFEERKIVLARLLRDLEIDIAGVFMPMPGSGLHVSVLKKYQREMLTIYAPNIDIENFFKENPILWHEYY